MSKSTRSKHPIRKFFDDWGLLILFAATAVLAVSIIVGVANAMTESRKAASAYKAETISDITGTVIGVAEPGWGDPFKAIELQPDGQEETVITQCHVTRDALCKFIQVGARVKVTTYKYSPDGETQVENWRRA